MPWPFTTRRKEMDAWSRLRTASAEATIQIIEANQQRIAQLMEEHASLVARRRELTERYEGMQDSKEVLDDEIRAVEAETEQLRAYSQVQKQRIQELKEREAQLLAQLKPEDALNIFERARDFVDARLQEVAPNALTQLAAAYERRANADPEALSHAATSCRRALKSLADALYPADGSLVVGADGRERRMSDDKFISRLLQFAAERSASSSSKTMAVQLNDLANRLDALNAAGSKGVHADITADEADQCIIQTYLLIGDFLRLAEQAPPEVES